MTNHLIVLPLSCSKPEKGAKEKSFTYDGSLLSLLHISSLILLHVTHSSQMMMVVVMMIKEL